MSSIGALNGWTLMMGQVPMAAAQDGLFPTVVRSPVAARRAGDRHRRSRPALATALVLVQVSGAPGFAAIYNLIVSLSTMAAVIPYVFCALRRWTDRCPREGRRTSDRIGGVEVVAFLFSVFTFYGCGATAVLYGLMLLLFGIPVYVWQQRRRAR